MVVRWYLLRRLLVIFWVVTFLISIILYSFCKYNNAVDHDIRLNFENRLHKLQDDLRRVCLISFHLI